MAESDAVDDAMIAKLTEPTLAGLMPGGVFVDVATGPATQFVIVSMLGHEDRYMFGGTAFERFVYLVKAVEKSNRSNGNVRLAARRIHALLQEGAAAYALLAIAGYVHDSTRRIERIGPIVEVDDVDRNIRWQHQGGHYEVLVTPA